jgi:hypothetical protein
LNLSSMCCGAGSIVLDNTTGVLPAHCMSTVVLHASADIQREDAKPSAQLILLFSIHKAGPRALNLSFLDGSYTCVFLDVSLLASKNNCHSIAGPPLTQPMGERFQAGANAARFISEFPKRALLVEIYCIIPFTLLLFVHLCHC